MKEEIEMGDHETNQETRLAVIETDIKYIKDKIDSFNFEKSFEKQGGRIGKLEQDLAVLKAKVASLTWVLAIVGSTAVASLTTAILKLIGV